MNQTESQGTSNGNELTHDELHSAQKSYVNLLFRYLLLTAGDALFVILPLVVIILESLLRGESEGILAGPEWSFAATILFGQALFRITAAISSIPRAANWQVVGFVVAAIFVFGVVPSLVTLSFLLGTTSPPTEAVILQLVLFAISLLLFLLLGASGYALAVREAEDRGTRWLLRELDDFELEGDLYRKVEEVRSKIRPPRRP